jgi:hypothetical protein
MVKLKNRVQNNLVNCTKCHQVKEYNNSNFMLYEKLYICRECINKLSNIRKYKSKHNIILDFNKMFDTYTPLEWYKYFIQGQIPKIPYEITRNEENRKEIIKHVICNVLNKKSRNQIITITDNDFKKYRIYYLKKNRNICDLLNEIFPKYNFKEWEFAIVPSGFWKNKNNADDYLRWFVNNKLTMNEINIKVDIPKVFSVDALRKIGEHKLNAIIHSFKHYDNYFEWISKVFPDWDLKESDFNSYFSFDGIEFRSREECILYEFIKRNLGLSIISTGNKRKGNKYFNEIQNESYYPDFLIKNKEKPIIIEYFGMLRLGEKSKSEIFIKYKEKTERKIEYFSNLEDAYFIDLYPDDLKEHFKGVKGKLNKYIKQGG